MLNAVRSSIRSMLYTLTVVTVVVAGNAQPVAADDKRYPGTYCRPDFYDRSKFGVGGGIDVYNRSTSHSLTVYCPIVRDEMADYFPRIEYAVVSYHNLDHPARRVVCWLEQRRRNGELVSKETVVAPHRGFRGFNTITLRPKRSSIYTPRLFYQVGCTLPASVGTLERERVKIYGYVVRETD